ncbi:MAG: hypothetical protein RBU37_03885 [Myxococcota bacterium]|nr:hypothetical protein [Myxococcota bacterium]
MRWLAVLVVMLLCGGCATTDGSVEGESATKVDPDTVIRVPVEEAREKVQDGTALLVCAYDDDSFERFKLEGAIKRGELEAMRSTLAVEQEIIFYCA